MSSNICEIFPYNLKYTCIVVVYVITFQRYIYIYIYIVYRLPISNNSCVIVSLNKICQCNINHISNTIYSDCEP